MRGIANIWNVRHWKVQSYTKLKNATMSKLDQLHVSYVVLRKKVRVIVGQFD